MAVRRTKGQANAARDRIEKNRQKAKERAEAKERDKVKPPKSTKPPKAPKAPPKISRPGRDDVADVLDRAKAKQRVLANAARADIAEIKKLLTRIRSDFYDVGLVLIRLKKPAAYRALGHESFADLVETELGISKAVATRLVGIAENVSRELATQVGQSHAWALVRLAMATPEDDTADELATRTLTLPTGEVLHVPTASVRAKNAAAAALRQGRQSPGRGGNTTTAEERQIAKEIEASLRALGVAKAKVSAKATRAGQAAELRLEGVPMSALDQLCRAICPEG